MFVKFLLSISEKYFKYFPLFEDASFNERYLNKKRKFGIWHFNLVSSQPA